jgi:lipoprotein NlpD
MQLRKADRQARVEGRNLKTLLKFFRAASAYACRCGVVILPTLIISSVFFSGCAAERGGQYHTVKKGETLWRISKHYGVNVKDVAEANNIKKPGDLETGKRIKIPGAQKHPKTTAKNHDTPLPISRNPVQNTASEERNKRFFSWPVKGAVSSHFGMRDGVKHDGIDIRAHEGAPIKAADDGYVVYISESMRGYGNIIILSHSGNYYTVYAHNKQNLVKNAAKVVKGDVIGTVGATGNATGFHLHFEVRRGKSTLNPIFYLPSS